MESRDPVLLPLKCQKQCDQYHYHLTKLLPPVKIPRNSFSLSPSDQSTEDSTAPIHPALTSTDSLPLAISSIHVHNLMVTLPSHPGCPSPMHSTSFDHFVCPKKEMTSVPIPVTVSLQQPSLTNSMARGEKNKHDPVTKFISYGTPLVRALQLPKRKTHHLNRSDSSTKASKHSQRLHQAVKCSWWSIMTPPYLNGREPL